MLVYNQFVIFLTTLAFINTCQLLIFYFLVAVIVWYKINVFPLAMPIQFWDIVSNKEPLAYDKGEKKSQVPLDTDRQDKSRLLSFGSIVNLVSIVNIVISSNPLKVGVVVIVGQTFNYHEDKYGDKRKRDGTHIDQYKQIKTMIRIVDQKIVMEL